MSRARRVRAYARVSGEEQGKHGTSLAAQADEIRAWCKARGHPEPKVYSEVASGSRERLDDRVKLAELLAELEAGDLVVVSKVDRWSRDLVHAVDSIRKLVRSGIQFYAIGESCDPATPQGDQMLGIMAWAADAERQRIKDRTVGTRKRLRDTGHWVEGPPPYGYRVEARRLVVEPREAKIVRHLYEYALSHSLSETNEEGRRLDPEHAWDRGNTHKSLRQRWYLGEIKDTTGKWIKSHEPIVDADLFARVQGALSSRRHGGPRPRTPKTDGWLMRGLAVCAACGAKMGAAYSPIANEYYACGSRRYRKTCEAPYVPVGPADAEATRLTIARLRELRDELGRPARKPEPAKPAGEVEAERLRKQRERLIDLAADGRISAADLSARLKRVETRLGDLDAAKAAQERLRAAVRPERRAELLGSLETLETAWRRAKVPVRRGILARLAERITLSIDGPVVRWRDLSTLEL